MVNAIPKQIYNWVNGQEVGSAQEEWFDKLNPHNGKFLYQVARSKEVDVKLAVDGARAAQNEWANVPAVQRGLILHEIVCEMRRRRDEIARAIALETGKSLSAALGETEAAIQCGLFYASEGQRLYGRTTTSGSPNKQAMTIRESMGVAALIIAANTPIANVAWKVFPALICGNTAVLKAAEDTPATAWLFAKIAAAAGLPSGVFQVVQGRGDEAGSPLVQYANVDVISFTGSSRVGRWIAKVAGDRLIKVSLELGGKNPLIVCDDADLENACKWMLLSAFSNAGQRCASGSRIIVFGSVYHQFREMVLEATSKLMVGPNDLDDLGPVINEHQLMRMLRAVDQARGEGATVLVGGRRLGDPDHRDGFYMAPTLIENASPDADISTSELFGPIACLYRVKDYAEALTLANRSPYGLTACIHTRSVDRALEFTRRIQAGVAVVNAGTFGSEPHMPFGGIGLSGNGSREPGTEALDVYSNLKDVYLNTDPKAL